MFLYKFVFLFLYTIANLREKILDQYSITVPQKLQRTSRFDKTCSVLGRTVESPTPPLSILTYTSANEERKWWRGSQCIRAAIKKTKAVFYDWCNSGGGEVSVPTVLCLFCHSVSQFCFPEICTWNEYEEKWPSTINDDYKLSLLASFHLGGLCSLVFFVVFNI